MEEFINKVLLGDCRLRLKNLPDNSVDSIVTDPPYELGFMNRGWDSSGVAYNVDMWRECLRVLKPGGHLLSFGGTRTYHRMACAVEDAGFEVRDQMQWIYGQGFPKNMNLGNGLGTALKPANEPIVLARKPIDAKTIKENVDKFGTGGLNIDNSRLPSDDGTEGRWPSNILLDEEAGELLDQQYGRKKGCSKVTETEAETTNGVFGKYVNRSTKTHDDFGGASRFFYCVKATTKERDFGLDGRERKAVNDGRETSIDNPYQRGDTERLNTHPTVKPIELMQYLVRLVTPANGIVLDPFCGSGSTLIAARTSGFKFIGIEMIQEFVDLSNERIKAYEGIHKFFK